MFFLQFIICGPLPKCSLIIAGIMNFHNHVTARTCVCVCGAVRLLVSVLSQFPHIMNVQFCQVTSLSLTSLTSFSDHDWKLFENREVKSMCSFELNGLAIDVK